MTQWDDITVAIGLALGGEQEQGRARLTACWERADEAARDAPGDDGYGAMIGRGLDALGARIDASRCRTRHRDGP